MLMDEGLDTGPMLLKRQIPIHPEDTGGSLEEKLAPIGAELLLETLAAWERRELTPEPQDDTLATLAPRIKKENARIDWNQTAEEISCRIRAFHPWPVAFSVLEGKTVKIFGAVVDPPGAGDPGNISAIEPDGIIVGCGSGTRLRILELQAEGKKRMSASDFARGQRLVAGKRFS
jgi:methionyl-tRNA formyltransferase